MKTQKPLHYDVLKDGSRRINALGYKRLLDKMASPEFQKAMKKIMKREADEKE